MDVETNQTQEVTETGASVATREDLIAAVKEAGGTASVDVAAEERAAQERAQQAEPTEDERLAAIMKTREERQAKKFDADEYAARVRQEAETEKQRMLDEARAEAKRVAAEELAAERAKFRGSPTAAMRALAAEAGGVDQLVEMVNREGSPEWQALQKTQEELRQTRELASKGNAALEEIQKMRAEAAQERQMAERMKVQTEYLTQFASAEKTPHLHARFDADEIFERSVRQAQEWAKEGLVYKKDFDDGDIATYLEKQSRERFEKSGLGKLPAQQSGAGSVERPTGLAPKSAANGTRTLSVAQGSERRTSPKPFNELTPEQQREELIAEVAAARRMNPDAKW